MHARQQDVERSRAGTALPALVALALFAACALWIAAKMAFPSTYDELQHLSVVEAQREAPQLFADARDYRVLDARDPSRWSAKANYINHPSLYYLLMAPLRAATPSILALRLANVALALMALAILLWAALPRLAPAARWPFAILAGAFPKAAVIAGMVNNDNLAALAASMVFAGLVGAPGAAWWIAIGLALAGWSKLTALIALGAVAGVHLILRMKAGPRSMGSRALVPIAIGAAIGALPYLVTWWHTGALLYVNDAAFFVPPALRPLFHPADFTSAFLRALVMKWPAAESHLPFPLALAVLGLPLLLTAVAATRRDPARLVATAYLAGTAILLVIHLWFAWSAYRRIGDLTIAQPRYYGVLWPGIALGAAAALGRTPRAVRVIALMLCLIPTVLGVVVLSGLGF
ncbi:conserved membrane hypothetical protein [Sphingomonas sp. EC-HK361]|uniref:hypothetical protein n=1 Tax=Sphingomonas sp. EC-HK361 TaxID=2038397 RepID=UPI00125857ED|nr:hypothetical protein [Sphingomonas sp. EC-HK361]VVS97328.1 conserved membrane hypothetical protein [Sphingomonas sp. EC-HK361]